MSAGWITLACVASFMLGSLLGAAIMAALTIAKLYDSEVGLAVATHRPPPCPINDDD